MHMWKVQTVFAVVALLGVAGGGGGAESTEIGITIPSGGYRIFASSIYRFRRPIVRHRFALPRSHINLLAWSFLAAMADGFDMAGLASAAPEFWLTHRDDRQRSKIVAWRTHMLNVRT